MLIPAVDGKFLTLFGVSYAFLLLELCISIGIGDFKMQKISPPAARFTPRIDYYSFVILSKLMDIDTVLIAKF